MKISVRTHGGKILSIDVNANDLVHRVKMKIEDMEDIPFDKQRLSFTGNDLANGQKLSDHNIQHGSLLTLGGMQINIKDWNGHAEGKHLTGETKIEEEKGLSQDQQHLMFGGSQLEGNLSLDDYKIKHQSIVNLERMKIYVKTSNGATFNFFVKPTNTIKEIKNMVRLKEGYCLEQQILLYGPTKLMDDCNLKEYPIPYKETLFLHEIESSSKA
jgi:hypothetical protein